MGEHLLRMIDVACPNCGEGCAGHEDVAVCAFDEEDWPCTVERARLVGYRQAIAVLRDAHRGEYRGWVQTEWNKGNQLRPWVDGWLNDVADFLESRLSREQP